HKNGKAYSAAIPYAEEYKLPDELWRIMTAHNLTEAKTALAELQLMAQNVMIGTVDGDIYYVRNGRVPVRPKGCDPSKPMPGSTGECEWRGIHSFDDLVQITNPHKIVEGVDPAPLAFACGSRHWLRRIASLGPDGHAPVAHVIDVAVDSTYHHVLRH